MLPRLRRSWPTLAAILLLLVSNLHAEVIDTSGAKAGTYILTIGADGTVAVSGPTKLVRLSDLKPTDPVDPDPSPDPFVEEVRKQTAAVLANGGSKTTGAALSAVYSLVSGGVAEGKIAPGAAFTAVKSATDVVMASQADKDKWTAWRTELAADLNALQSQGLLTTKDQVAGVLGDISKGIDKATGNTLDPLVLGKVRKGAEFAIDTDGTADGILDGIDLVKLIELIKLIMELLKLFGLGG